MRRALAPQAGATVADGVKAVRLSLPFRLAVPSLLISSIPKRLGGR